MHFRGNVLILGSFTGQYWAIKLNVIHTIKLCDRKFCTRTVINDEDTFIDEQYTVCMVLLHCYHDFRLGGLRKSTKMNCKMEVKIKCPDFQGCTAEVVSRNLSC